MAGTPEVVVHAAAIDVLGGSRSLDAVVDAMSWAASQHAIDRWALQLDGLAPEGLLHRVEVSGGSLVGPVEGIRTLTVPPDVVLCGASLVRLLRAEERTTICARPLSPGDACIMSPAVAAAGEPEEWPSAPVSRLRAGSVASVERSVSLLELALPVQITEARRAVSDALKPDGDPLLSVVMRTQAARPEATRDTLLSLAAQSDGRFELILVGHGIPVADAERLLSDQASWLRDRARVVAVEGGTRSRPLNRGIAEARGSHVAVLDDDDLVGPDWVAVFLKAAESSPSRLLRAGVLAQPVRTARWPDGITGHEEDGEPSAYPARYDLADHLRVNLTPFLAFAFPRAWLAMRGGADEDLEVCEDWDLGLRGAAELGVLDLPAETAVYRRWTTGGDSYSRHDAEVWKRDMERVIAMADERALLLGPGSARRLAELSRDEVHAQELAGIYAGASWRVTAPLRWVRRGLRRRAGRRE